MTNIRRVCTVSGDLSEARGALNESQNANGDPYWVMRFSIAIYFGQTSLSAELQWVEDVSLPHILAAVLTNLVGCVKEGQN